LRIDLVSITGIGDIHRESRPVNSSLATYVMSDHSKQLRLQNSRRASSLVTLVCLMVFSVTFVIYTSYYLPGTVATHFDFNSEPNGWMTRERYVLLILTLLVSVPTVISVGIGALSQKYPHLINIPNGDYWLAPQRQDESLDFLASHAYRLGRLVIVLMTGLHYLVLVANRTEPPILPESWFMAISLGFIFALIMWVIALYRRFPRS
jgi:uncharacterized membrane protein